MTWTTSTAGSASSASRLSYAFGTPRASGPRCAALRRAAEDAPDLDTDPTQRFHVDGTDEAGADDGRADLGQPHARCDLLHPGAGSIV